MISVVIPVYNEQSTVEEIIQRVDNALENFDREIIVVDDGSRDRTGIILDTLAFQGRIRLIRHSSNIGKGEAIKSALKVARGEITVIQDADLEYSPDDLLSLINEVANNGCLAVYGSRNLKKSNQVGYWPFLWGGRFLSLVATVLFGQCLTDINTGYKVFRTDFIRSLGLKSTGFEFCEEVTAKVLNRGVKIKEVPISYYPRKFSEGKKIRATDGLKALMTLLRHRFQRR